MKVEIKIAGKKEDVKDLGQMLYMVLNDWNFDAKRKGREKARIDIAEVCKMYDNTGRIG